MKKNLFNIIMNSDGQKELAGPFKTEEHRDAYGLMAEAEPDPKTWVGKVEIDISTDYPMLKYKEVLYNGS